MNTPRPRPGEILGRPDRLAAIAASDLLPAGVVPALGRVVRAAARLLDVSVAQLNVVTADQQIPISHVGSEAWGRAVPLDRSYCQHVITSGEPLVIEDAREHPQVASSLATRESGIVGYLSIPILSPRAEHPIATLCVVDFRPRSWSEREVSVLTELAAWALSEIELRAAQLEIQNRADAAVRESEARYRAVVEQGPAALAILEGPEHLFTLVSPTYERWAGRGALTGRRFVDALPELRGSPFDRAHARVYATGEAMTVREVAATVDRDGNGVPEEYVFTVHYTALRDGAGEVYAVTSLVEDHTDQVRTRRELEIAHEITDRARAEAEGANRAKSDFLATMSHELRTPLNAIGGYAELMELGIHGGLTDAQREDLRRIQQSQRHLLGLINEVLNYARLEAGTVRFDLATVPVRESVTAAQELVVPQARARGLTLRLEEGPPALSVRADPEKLRQVLVNLLGNAVKFTGDGGRIAVSYGMEGEEVAIRVRDTGMGIPKEKLEGIFDPFVQVRSDLTRTAEGTGLGLAISRELARAMGGDLTAESTPGEGSVFTLRLPVGTGT